jgi:hypothetical protein
MEEKRHQGLRQQYLEALNRQRMEERFSAGGPWPRGSETKVPSTTASIAKDEVVPRQLARFLDRAMEMQFEMARTCRATIPQIFTLVGSHEHTTRWLLVVFCRRRETLLAIFEQDEGYKTSENVFAGIGTSPSPMLGADQVSRKPGVQGFYLARDKRRSLFDFSHLRKPTHSIRLADSWSSILNLHELIHSRHRLLCLTHECNELLNLNARGNKAHVTPSFLCF